MIRRIVNLSKNNSFFLFGPRGSGKSTLLHERFDRDPNHIWVDLLDPDEEALFQTDPSELKRRSGDMPRGSWVVIDEVQKAPKLLDLVHKLIEERGLLFALSGSSARKLKRGGANLLAGRAFIEHLYPFSVLEVAEKTGVQKLMEWGSLPKLFSLPEEEDKKRFLQAYAHTYLKEEIQAEQISRNLPNFRKFLEIAAQMNGRPLNYSKIARDVHTDHAVIRNYFSILEDTLIGFHLPAYDQSIRRQQRKAPKFYFVDCGIKRALDKTLCVPLNPRTYEYGRAFEHFFVLEVFKLCQYRARDETLSYLQTKDGVEVDLIIERPGKERLFVEIKSADRVNDSDVSSLKRVSAGLKNMQAFVVSQDPDPKRMSHVRAVHWRSFLQSLQAGEW